MLNKGTVTLRQKKSEFGEAVSLNETVKEL